MSRSNPQLKNPAKRFIQWRGGEEKGGVLEYYDKQDEQTVDVPIPFTFLVLDELNTISGFSDRDKSSYWSNEVRNLQTDELIVKTSAGTKARGVYADLDDVKSKGAKYAKSVYIAFKDETGELVIGNIKIMGAALTAWIEFQKKWNVNDIAVKLAGVKKAKKGSTIYFIPVFEALEVTEATNQAALELDKELQSFLNSYLNRKPEEAVVVDDEAADDDTTTEDDEEIEEIDDNPEPETTAPAPKKTATKKAAPAQGDKTIDLKDVPF